MRVPFRNRYFFASDILLIPVATYLSFVLRLEDLNLTHYWPGLVLCSFINLLATLLIFHRAGVYSRYWRYASIEDLLLLAGAITAATFVAGTIELIIDRLLLPEFGLVPRSVPFIFLMLGLAATASPRLALRLVSSYRKRPRRSANRMPALIMGAGSAGTMMLRELQHNAQLGMEVVGFVDDDPAKLNVRIHGIPVLGNHQDIPDLVKQFNVNQVIIAMPTAPGKTIRTVVSICEKAGVKTKIIPGIFDLIDGRVSVNQLRNVEIEDLLRRKPVRTDTAAVGELIHGRRVLITGGGGSIGSELCRQVLRFEPSELVILGHGENSIFTIFNEVQKQPPKEIRIEAVIADIRFADRIKQVFEEYRPEIIFHAAAHKHVPLMELRPAEAVTNNILGTRNLLDAALVTGVEHFVMVSTDKAVNPTSIMGATKRVAELLVLQAARISGRRFVAVRFGNVLGSRGSVVLTFKQQIAAGGPVTVTHPEMRRYFMTIPEAVQLTLQAATLGQGGDIFTLDMGEPVKIVDLARDMIELSGLEIGHDIDIAFTGIRPGEKLYEELFVPGEDYERTLHEKIFIAQNASNFVPIILNEATRALEIAVQRDDRATILRTLHLLIPQMRRSAHEAPTASEVLEVANPGEAAVTEKLLARVVGS